MILPVLRILFGIPSSPSRDAAILLRGIHPRPAVLNEHNIPGSGPFILVLNHYDRPGLGAWWGVSVVMCAVAARRTEEPKDIRFTMVREWWYPGGFGRAVKQPMTRWAFGQLSKAYGTVLLPPVLEDNEYRGEGVVGIRRAVALTGGAQPQIVGAAPEGRTGDRVALCRPPDGAGLFLLLLSRDRVPFVPAGIYENDDRVLTVRFGVPFYLNVPRSPERRKMDCGAATRIMVEIGKTLPERMWGDYAEEIRQATGDAAAG